MCSHVKKMELSTYLTSSNFDISTYETYIDNPCDSQLLIGCIDSDMIQQPRLFVEYEVSTIGSRALVLGSKCLLEFTNTYVHLQGLVNSKILWVIGQDFSTLSSKKWVSWSFRAMV